MDDTTRGAADVVTGDKGPEFEEPIGTHADSAVEVHADDHPDPGVYVRVAAILAIVTAIEVALYYTDVSGILLVSILVGLAAIKFGMVVAYFMHLRFDGRLLRRLFVTGVILALFVFSVALFTMDILFR